MEVYEILAASLGCKETEKSLALFSSMDSFLSSRLYSLLKEEGFSHEKERIPYYDCVAKDKARERLHSQGTDSYFWIETRKVRQ